MIDVLMRIGFILFLPSFILWVSINIYLSIKFRKKRYKMINGMCESAPEQVKERARLIFESNFSWVFASSFLYTWYGYMMLRFAWKISRKKIINWRKSIKKNYGKHGKTYVVFSNIVNISMLGFFILISSLALEYVIR
ncbi:hypothetical protein [Salinivibrio costicola]|uniref:hypothetical protein n=1 Tax=Salinivibrio costicola TaxID=51367 RepID=UPI0004727E1E|nr:hypothetical protein [Salinivibrio costicola]